MNKKPYYQDNFVTLYHGDSRELLPAFLKFDIVATDPPYGMQYQSRYRRKEDRKKAIAGDSFYDFEMLAVLKSLARSALYVFGRWDNLLKGFPSPKSVLVWDKGNHSMGDLEHEYGRRWEMCAFWPGEKHAWRGNRPVDVLSIARVNGNALEHPTEKPVALMGQLLSHSDGKTVLDPYAGGGSTLVAAKQLGLKATGVEIEEEYCELMLRRLQQEYFPFDE